MVWNLVRSLRESGGKTDEQLTEMDGNWTNCLVYTVLQTTLFIAVGIFEVIITDVAHGERK